MDGKWLVTVHTYMGDMRSHYEFKVNGNALEGKCTDASNGAVAPIVDGKYDNGSFSFQLTIKTAVGEMTNNLTGKYENGKLSGKSKNAMGEFDFDGVRE